MNTFSILPGQSLPLHDLFKSPVHSLPPYFAEIEIFLFCVPGPHLTLQLDHGDIMQSTKFGINLKILDANQYKIMLHCDWSKVLKAGAPELSKNFYGF